MIPKVARPFISIHAPARGATLSCLWRFTSYTDFNPRSREGSDNFRQSGKTRNSISIHAPARGATAGERGARKMPQFQSTLPRGERQPCNGKTGDAHEFQSTLPRGERPAGYNPPEPVPCISIHAPARGATLHDVCKADFYTFQSTLPRGERPFSPSLSFNIFFNFNPRSREGSDLAGVALLVIVNQFQSTLPRGERPGKQVLPADRTIISIHAPARGATTAGLSSCLLPAGFQSTLPRGERLARKLRRA